MLIVPCGRYKSFVTNIGKQFAAHEYQLESESCVLTFKKQEMRVSVTSSPLKVTCEEGLQGVSQAYRGLAISR